MVLQVPWKLLKRPSLGTLKRVYVCPERSCLHHDPSHALGDLVGIKKHYRRKHCTEKQWKCDKCSKGYAVQSDYKAHLKTCGTRGHCCDCGRVFSRCVSNSAIKVCLQSKFSGKLEYTSVGNLNFAMLLKCVYWTSLCSTSRSTYLKGSLCGCNIIQRRELHRAPGHLQRSEVQEHAFRRRK